MIHQSIAVIESFLATYGVGAFFLLGFFEEIIFIIPSAFLFLAMGFLGISASLSPQIAFAFAFGPVAFAGAFGVLFGASFMYALSYWGGKPLIERFGKYFGVRWNEIEKMNRFFEMGYTDELVFLVLRAIPIFPISVVSIVSGVMRIHPLVFAITTFVGTFFRIGSLSFFGWYVGREFSFYAEKIALFEQIIMIAAVVICIVFFVARRKRRKLPK